VTDHLHGQQAFQFRSRLNRRQQRRDGVALGRFSPPPWRHPDPTTHCPRVGLSFNRGSDAGGEERWVDVICAAQQTVSLEAAKMRRVAADRGTRPPRRSASVSGLGVVGAIA
jgi:hypothetical protein